jgi:hypothetical protein
MILGLLGGCASAPKPTEQVAATSASMRAASEVGADKVPAAALYLQLAQEQTEQAQALIAKDDNERAQRLLMRAQADAELALALARAEQERALAQSAIARTRSLQTNN